MALSKIWSAFIIISILAATFQAIFVKGHSDIFSRMVVGESGDTTNTRAADTTKLSPAIMGMLAQGKDYVDGTTVYARTADGAYIKYYKQRADGVVGTAKVAVDISINLIGIMALFMGFMSIAEKAGGIRLLSKIIGPFFSKLFPELPKNHPAMGHMVMNFSANLLGLDNAATPFGLKAMESLQEINPNKDTASNSQVMFLCLHASGLTLIPVSIIAIRASLHASNPTDIFIPCMIATFMATIAAMMVVSFKQKINVFQPVILMWVLGISAVIAGLVIYLKSLSFTGVQTFSGILSNGLILFIFFIITLGGFYKKIDVFGAFIDGAKGGFEIAVKIIPYLVGMLVAISLLRTSGTFEFIVDGMRSFFAWIGTDTRFVDGLPTALIKPLSGSAARGMMVDTMTTFGSDSFAGSLSSVLQGSSDTTFYVVAVYYGAVSVKNTRYTIGAMLLADLVGIITAILLAYLFFGNAV
ncbi:MAG: spore maturation protein [Chitinophagaceae bacterium]|nr:spore maturation protein [Chitinophagaceae bacterium]MCW5914208.1 spore maturation protein [Chitinophagaceae bacterium]MCZ2395130.1 spore maturation protein [Chitinophagales bacterium]